MVESSQTANGIKPPWQIKNKLGEGGYGQVHLSEHPETKEKQAVKII